MSIVAEFDAGPERVWQLWADPRELERWWGPPGYPATFTRHDLAPGSRVEWHMTGPEGDRQNGYWDIVDAEGPDRLVFRGGFADADGTPSTDLPPYETRVAIEAIAAGRCRMSILTTFPSRDVMERLLGMGMDEGWAASLGQINSILAEDAGTRS
jgi:uncharacterized protein YndB with AHSA1/START domain